MNQVLHGKLVAILVADGAAQSELESPRLALRAAGASADIIAPKNGLTLQAVAKDGAGRPVNVDRSLTEASPDDYDALVLPGGDRDPDRLRGVPEAVKFVRAFFAAGKSVAAICRGLQVLIEAGVVQGRTVTSWPALKNDLINAGAIWIDQPVVVDRGLVTSRRPADLAPFNARMIEEISEGRPRSWPPATKDGPARPSRGHPA